jgi:hypothetical protein
MHLFEGASWVVYTFKSSNTLLFIYMICRYLKHVWHIYIFIYLILHLTPHLFSFPVLPTTEATDTEAASFTLRRRAMSGQFTHFFPACSETGDSATAMFLLLELVDVCSNCVFWELWRVRCSQSTRREPHLLELLSCTIFHLLLVSPACISECKRPRFLSRASKRDFYAWQ